MKTLCAWCDRILAVPFRWTHPNPRGIDDPLGILWNETKWPDEAEYIERMSAPENVSHGICAECRREKFEGSGDVILVRNRLPQRLMLHAVKPHGQTQIFLTIADEKHFPPHGSTEILGCDVHQLAIEETEAQPERASPQTQS